MHLTQGARILLYLCIRFAALGNLKAAFIALVCCIFAKKLNNKQNYSFMEKEKLSTILSRVETEPKDGSCIVHGLAPEVPSTST